MTIAIGSSSSVCYSDEQITVSEINGLFSHKVFVEQKKSQNWKSYKAEVRGKFLSGSLVKVWTKSRYASIWKRTLHEETQKEKEANKIHLLTEKPRVFCLASKIKKLKLSHMINYYFWPSRQTNLLCLETKGKIVVVVKNSYTSVLLPEQSWNI